MSPISLLIAVVIFTLLGCVAGIVTGLVPGLHVNNIAHIVLVSESAMISLATVLFGWANPSIAELTIIISSLIIGTVVTHTFLDFIPSAFLGAPDADTALSVLPGHRMMLAGRGYEAVKCSVIGSFGAIVVALILIIPLRLFIGEPVDAYSKFEGLIHFVLIAVSVFLILGEMARPKSEFGNFNSFEVDGFVLSSAVGVGEAAHKDVLVGSEIHKDTEEPVAISGKVKEVVDGKDGNYLWLKCDGKNVRVRMNARNHYEPGVGDSVTVIGDVSPVATWKDHMAKRGMALGVFLLAGLFGVILLSSSGICGQNLYLVHIPTSDTGIILLFPMFTGLFGIPTLLLSLKDKPTIPSQKVKNVKVNVAPKDQAKNIVSGSIASISSLFPGISSAISTMIAVNLHGDKDDSGRKKDESSEFIISVSAVNTSVGIFNLLALFIIMKSRSGAMKSVEAIMGDRITEWSSVASVPLELSAMLVAAVIAAVIALFLTLYFGKLFAKHCSKIDYQKLVWGVIIFLLAMTIIFSGLLGLVILGIGTCIGLIPPLVGIRRVHLMGSLVLPIILHFL